MLQELGAMDYKLAYGDILKRTWVIISITFSFLRSLAALGVYLIESVLYRAFSLS